MKIKFIIPFFLLLSFFCNSQDKLTGKDYIFGVIITCVTDSTSFLNSDTIVLDLAERDYNNDCPNKPKSSRCCMPWPSEISLDLSKGNIFLATNKEIVLDANGEVKSLSHKPRQGKFKYNKKADTIKISFKQYHWTRTFKVLYRKQDNSLTLTKTL